MKINIRVTSLVLLLFLFMFVVPCSVFADTHISDTSIDSTQSVIIWSKESSPYILDTDAYFYPGMSLIIDPGVEVFAATDTPSQKSIYINGSLLIRGTKESPVTISGISSFFISHSSSTINNLILRSSDGIYFNHSTSTIVSSDISGVINSKAISASASTVSISLSKIKNNAYGIYSYYVATGPVFAKRDITAMGGIGNALGDDPAQNHISIASSSMTGNTFYSIYNQTSNTIDARNNWWGSSSGPNTILSGANTYGPVDVEPWLNKDPDEKDEGTICCSNVLFLPGFEASRLYRDERGILGGIFGTSTNTLWEPNRNDDVRKLFMTKSGESLDKTIYTKDIIGRAFGFGIYANFVSMMDGLVSDKTLNQWSPFPYDWRYSVDTINTIPTLLSLASTSKTGKVTIVAHSNGGLVAKELVDQLNKTNQSGLIDKIIFVAVPELGTPQAIAGLLHGDKQAMLGGLILGQDVARQMGENSPGAYGLLPSSSYFSNLLGTSFENAFSSVVSFSSSTLDRFHLAGNSQTLSSYDALRSFLSGFLDHRPAPATSDTDLPILLSNFLLDKAKKVHDTIDNLTFSSSTKIVSLIGWGNKTLTGLNYFEKKECGGPTRQERALPAQCRTYLDHVASTTYYGDGTVVGVSAKTPTLSYVPIDLKNYYFDLGSLNKWQLIKDDHSSILNTDSGVAFVKQQITDQKKDVVGVSNSLPQYISDKEPTPADIHDDELTVAIHSPVELHMYDKQGRHTGIIPNPDPTSDLGRYETGIPGSGYSPVEGDTRIDVPYGTDYRVELKGIGTGSFGVDVVHNVNDHDVSSFVFTDLPVSPLLKAELILSTTTSLGAGTSTVFATTSPLLLLDFDGNGTVDATTKPSDHFDKDLNDLSTRTIVSALEKDPHQKKAWLDKFDKVVDHLRRGIPLKHKKEKNIPENRNDDLEQILDKHWRLKDLDDTQRTKLLNLYKATIDGVDVGD